jgi:glycosyltransferase involved in cell wall biosynthesis
MTIPINAFTGWGVYGTNLAIQLLARGITPIPTDPPNWESMHPSHRTILAGAEPVRKKIDQMATERPGREIKIEGPVLTALGHQFTETALYWNLKGTAEIGTIFLESTALNEEAVKKGKRFDKIIAGSSWNERILRKHGLDQAVTALQGVDPKIFHPAPRSGQYAHDFVIFSGGKLEYRKGQDIVIAAVRIFQQLHPDALLLTAWHNLYPRTMAEIAVAGHVTGAPKQGENSLADFNAWIKAQGIKRFVDIGPQFNWQLGSYLRNVDVAIFPNRAEGGTNLVAMECMACGIPTLLSANTGHLDLISEEICYPMKKQYKPAPTPFYPNVEDWGESSVEEIVQTLELVYIDRRDARARGKAAAEAIKKLSWENQVSELLAHISPA